jgi:hypothetical protein
MEVNWNSAAVQVSKEGVLPPRCVDDILRCGVYGTLGMGYHDLK